MDGCTEIEREAFKCCFALKTIIIPSSVEKIGRDVFYQCNEELTIFVKDGSYAKEYCEKNGLDFEIME